MASVHANDTLIGYQGSSSCGLLDTDVMCISQWILDRVGIYFDPKSLDFALISSVVESLESRTKGVVSYMNFGWNSYKNEVIIS